MTMLFPTDPPLLTALAGGLPAFAGIALPSGIDWSLVLIPPITGIIGYVTNWVGIRLLFHPVDFRGISVPGMQQVAQLLPTKIQQIPGVIEGRLGWQGIVPSRAAKMGSLAVDNGISKVATQREFYEQFDPQEIAEHVVADSKDELHDLVDEIIRREHPQLWADLPQSARNAVHARIDAELPGIVDEITEEIGENIDELLDLKMMVIEHLSENPELLNKIFLEVGDRELKFLVNSGFVLGTLLGCFSIPLFLFIDKWWVLPMAGVLVGYFTNWIAIKAIFNPVQEHRVGPFRIQGLFVKRQPAASETYASVIAEDVVTLSNVAQNLLYGSKSDRTRQMIDDALQPAVDEAMGVAGPLARLTTGEREYEAIQESLASEAVDFAEEPLQDPVLNRRRSSAIQQLIAERMKVLPPADYTVMLRSAFKEDEWLLIGIGAALGFVAGWIQLLVVTSI